MAPPTSPWHTTTTPPVPFFHLLQPASRSQQSPPAATFIEPLDGERRGAPQIHGDSARIEAAAGRSMAGLAVRGGSGGKEEVAPPAATYGAVKGDGDLERLLRPRHF
uniref:Uncharacterized protein n=1 Tax=Arundo donax TaxID=35708 RepID=A0A0A9D379_ARUDO